VQRLQARLLLVAGAVVVLGSLLPWHIVHGGGHSLNIDGIDAPNNGLITLALGLALTVIAWRMVEQGNRPRRTVLALTIVTAAATVWALLDASNADDDFNGPLTLERTYGQWVLLAGALLALVGGILMARRDETPAAGPNAA
jgi:drug/metabolite transporter (DMT)-like permease